MFGYFVFSSPYIGTEAVVPDNAAISIIEIHILNNQFKMGIPNQAKNAMGTNFMEKRYPT